MLSLHRGNKKQPQTSADIEWNNGLSKGLIRAYQFNLSPVGTGTPIYEAVTGELISITSSDGDAQQVASKYGKGKGLTTNASSIVLNDDGAKDLIADQLTVHLLYKPITAAGNDFIFGNTDTSVTTFPYGFFYSGGNINAYVQNSTGSNAVATTSLPLETYVALTLVYNGSRVDIWKEGVQTTGATLTGNVRRDLSQPMTINAWNGGQVRGEYYGAWIWNRALSNEQVFSLYVNPWQTFKEQKTTYVLYTTASGTSVALSGQSVTANYGTLVESITYALSGQSVTSSAGTVVNTLDYTISGQSVTSVYGSLSVDVSYSLSGSALTSSAGTVTVDTGTTLVSLTGVSASFNYGTITPNVSYTLSGQSSTSEYGSVTPSIPLSGASATTASGTLIPSPYISLSGIALTGYYGSVTATGGDTTRIEKVTFTFSPRYMEFSSAYNKITFTFAQEQGIE